MKKKTMCFLCCVAATTSTIAFADDIGTAFTYQGELIDNGTPINGVCDFEFSLWDDAVAGSQVGTTLVLDNGTTPITVVDGRFTVKLDFDIQAITGHLLWVQIDVCCPTGCSPALTPLLPRQEITPSPYSTQTRGIAVDADGNVGIGTVNPATRIDVEVPGVPSGLTPSLRLGQSTAGDNTQDALSGTELELFGNDRVWAKLSGGTRGLTTGREGFLSFSTRDASNAAGVMAERIRIIGTGNVGIGTVNPTSRLHVLGGVMIDDPVGNVGFQIRGGGNNDTGIRLVAPDGGGLWSIRNDVSGPTSNALQIRNADATWPAPQNLVQVL